MARSYALKAGTVVRLKVRLIGGEKGLVRVAEDYGGDRDGAVEILTKRGKEGSCMRYELAVVRNPQRAGECEMAIESTTSHDDDTARLAHMFKLGPLREWATEDITKDKLMRYAQTYLMMARAGYRPAAPSDGLGNIQLEREELDDPERLHLEAIKYAMAFEREEDGCRFNIGCSNWSTNRAFILCIEAARLLAGGGDQYASRLLSLATKEIGKAKKSERRSK